jgi:hypothetical protein
MNTMHMDARQGLLSGSNDPTPGQIRPDGRPYTWHAGGQLCTALANITAFGGQIEH